MAEIKYEIEFSLDLAENSVLNEPKRGRLVIDRVNGIRIETSERINTVACDEKINIYGQTVNGDKFTAFDCILPNISSLIVSEFHNKDACIEVTDILSGEYYQEQEPKDIYADKMTFSCSHLLEWLKESEKKEMSFAINRRNQSIAITINNSQNSTIKFAYHEPKPLGDFIEEANLFLNFLQVFISPKLKVSFSNIYFEINGKTVSYFLNQHHFTESTEENAKINPVYISYFSEDNFYNIIQKWFESCDKYGRIFSILNAVLYDGSFIYTEIMFLTYAQWIEGYCRVKYSPSGDNSEFINIEEENYKATYEKIKNAISSSNINDKEKVLKQLESIPKRKYKNKVTLVSNLYNIMRDLNFSSILNIGHESMCDLAENIKNARDNHTHIAKENEDTLYLAYLSRIMRDIVILILMAEMDIDLEINQKNKFILETIKNHYTEYISIRPDNI